MISVEYSKAIAEVLDILKHTNREDVNKISPEFMSFLKDNAAKNYIPQFNHTNSITSLNLNEKTIGILSVINSQFWCTPEQKELFDSKLMENERRYQEELRKKYNPDDIFKDKQRNVQNQQIKNANTSIITYKKSLFHKIINKIKLIFHNPSV